MVVRVYANATEVVIDREHPQLTHGELPDGWTKHDWSDLPGAASEQVCAEITVRFDINYKSNRSSNRRKHAQALHAMPSMRI